PLHPAPRPHLRLPRADGPRARARRRPCPGHVRQGLPGLRQPRGCGPRPRVAVPDRPSRRARRVPAPQDRALPALDRRIARGCPVRGAPRLEGRFSGDMERALMRMPERQRAALILAELHDLTGLELAAALGVSHVAARALLTRARESLRQALAIERSADAAADAAAEAAAIGRH